MAKVLSLTGIATGEIIKASEISQSIDALTGNEAYDITISGSLTLTGSVDSLNGYTGSLSGSATNATTASVAQQLEVTYIPTAGGLAPAFMEMIAGGSQLSSGTVTITDWGSAGTGELVGKTLGTNLFLTVTVSGSGGAAGGHLEVDFDGASGNITVSDGASSNAEFNYMGIYLA